MVLENMQSDNLSCYNDDLLGHKDMIFNIHSLRLVNHFSSNIVLFSTGCSLNIVFFPSDIVIFLNPASSAAVLVFYLPVVYTHTDTKSPEYS